jgi:hypothetical protein
VLIGAEQLEQPGLLWALADALTYGHSATVWTNEPRTHAQKGRLAGTVLADDCHRLSRTDRQRDIIEDELVPEPL